MKENDRLLAQVKRAMQNDSVAFEAVCREKARLILFLCIREMANEQDGQDAAQEVFIRMHKYIRDIKDPRVFNTWLSRIVFSTCGDMKRSRRRHLGQLPLDKVAEESLPDMLNTLPQDFVEDEDKRQRLINCVDNLPDKYKASVLLHYYQRYSYKQIADVLGISVNAVENNLRMARRILKLELENEFGADYTLYSGAVLAVGTGLNVAMSSAQAAIPVEAAKACLLGAGIQVSGVAVAAGSAGVSLGALAKGLAAVAVVTALGAGTVAISSTQAGTAMGQPPASVVQAQPAPTASEEDTLPSVFLISGAGGTVSGRVCLPATGAETNAGSGLAGVRLELWKQDNEADTGKSAPLSGDEAGWEAVQETFTESMNGSFRFEKLAAGRYVLCLYLPAAAALSPASPTKAVAGGTAPPLQESPRSGSVSEDSPAQDRLFLLAASDGAEAEIWLEVAIEVRGRVKLTDSDGQPMELEPGLLEALRVQLLDPQGHTVGEATLLDDGVFVFQNLKVSQSGTYTVLVTGGGAYGLDRVVIEVYLEPGKGKVIG